MNKIRKTGRQDQHTAVLGMVASLALLVGFVPVLSAAIADGTTAGKLKTVVQVIPKITGTDQSALAATDDHWDLSAETDTIAATRRAYWLYEDGTFLAGTDIVGTDLEALAHLPAITETKSVIGVYIAGPATDFDDVGGLAAQGTIENQIPDGAYIGVPGVKYTKPAAIQLVAY